MQKNLIQKKKPLSHIAKRLPRFMERLVTIPARITRSTEVVPLGVGSARLSRTVGICIGGGIPRISIRRSTLRCRGISSRGRSLRPSIPVFGPPGHVGGIPNPRNSVSISTLIGASRDRTSPIAICERIGDQKHDSDDEGRESSVHSVHPFC